MSPTEPSLPNTHTPNGHHALSSNANNGFRRLRRIGNDNNLTTC